jgi:hypothetical protein
MKLRILKLSIIASAFLLTSCVKKLIEDSLDSVECVEKYSEFAGAEIEGDCADQAEAIQGILDSCGSFLSSEQKAELKEVKAEYEAECAG